jgi:hypothetical protein
VCRIIKKHLQSEHQPNNMNGKNTKSSEQWVEKRSCFFFVSLRKEKCLDGRRFLFVLVIFLLTFIWRFFFVILDWNGSSPKEKTMRNMGWYILKRCLLFTHPGFPQATPVITIVPPSLSRVRTSFAPYTTSVLMPWPFGMRPPPRFEF